MLYIIGLGLSDVEDITCKGLKAVKASDLVYLEHYTSILGGGVSYVKELEIYYGNKLWFKTK
jgi:diphthine synthase